MGKGCFFPGESFSVEVFPVAEEEGNTEANRKMFLECVSEDAAMFQQLPELWQEAKVAIIDACVSTLLLIAQGSADISLDNEAGPLAVLGAVKRLDIAENEKQIIAKALEHGSLVEVLIQNRLAFNSLQDTVKKSGDPKERRKLGKEFLLQRHKQFASLFAAVATCENSEQAGAGPSLGETQKLSKIAAEGKKLLDDIKVMAKANVKMRLSAIKDELPPAACGDKWKEKLTATSSMAAVVEAAQPYIDSDFGSDLVSKFKRNHEDLANANRILSMRGTPKLSTTLMTLVRAAGFTCWCPHTLSILYQLASY